MVKKLVLLGSTGSIGRQALDVVRAFPERFKVLGLAAGQNIDLLLRQAAEFRPRFISCQSTPDIAGYNSISLEEMATLSEADIVVIATAGFSGLKPTLAAAEVGKRVALANKESLVAAGALITAAARRTGAVILPVDSEHSAIWQCLNGEKEAAALVLTASGGPFLNLTAAELERVSVAQALKHPSWHMGQKVTIDSATLMNKGLEVIEAHWLFGIAYERIKVVIHPQSIVHSIVEFVDGSCKAQLSYPDMRLPIQYALGYPERLDNAALPRLDWNKLCHLDFEPPDMERFPCLKLGIEAGRKGGTYPVVLAGADEAAVALFLAGRIGFTDIPRFIGQALERHKTVTHPEIEDILAADSWARETVLSLAVEWSKF